MHTAVAHRVLARGHVQRIRLRGEVEVVRLYSARRLVAGTVRMHADEQVCLSLVSDGGPRLQRDERVVAARVDDLRAQLVMQQLAKPQSHVEHHVLLHQAARRRACRCRVRRGQGSMTMRPIFKPSARCNVRSPSAVGPAT